MNYVVKKEKFENEKLKIFNLITKKPHIFLTEGGGEKWMKVGILGKSLAKD